MIFTPASQSEKATLEKIGEFLTGVSKNVLKPGSSTSLPTFLSNLEHTSNEICYMLQARDQNDYSHAINKYTQAWKDVFKSMQTPSQIHTEGECDLEPLSRAELMARMKKKLNETGSTGRFGGARIGGFQSPLAESVVSRQQGKSSALPSIRLNSFEQPTDRTLNNSSRMQYDLDDHQKCILNEVIKQSSKLNVQIVMRRYDPKIKLCITQGTDTNLDILEAMRNFKKEYHENKLAEIVHDSDKHSQELQKFLNDRIDYRHVQMQGQVVDKLKGVHKQMIQKTMDIDQVILETQKQQQDLLPNVLNEFLDYVNDSYSSVQHETYRVLMKFVNGFMAKKLKQDSEKKIPSQNSQQFIGTASEKRKAGPLRRADNTEQLQKELSNKNVELDRKFMENAELQNKIRTMENQITSLSVELESTKITEKAVEQERTQLQYEKQKMEKLLAVYQGKTYMDQAIQVSDQSLQQIQKLQKENAELQQRIYALMAELNKKKSIVADQKSLHLELGNSQEQSISPKGTTGRMKSQQFEFGPDEDNLSIGYRGESNRQISDYTKRQSTDLVYRTSMTQHVQSSRQDNGKPSKNVSSESRRSIQHSMTEYQSKQPNRSALDQRSIQELDEEQIQKSGLLIQQGSVMRESLSPRNVQQQLLRKMSTMSKSESQLKTQVPRKSNVGKIGDQSARDMDVDVTQSQTIQDTQRTVSGRMNTLTEKKDYPSERKIGDKKESYPSERRIQTESPETHDNNITPQSKGIRQNKKSDTLLTTKPKNKYARKSTDQIRDVKEEQQNKMIDNSKCKVIKEEDEISRYSKSNLDGQSSRNSKSNSRASINQSPTHIRRSSTTVPQQQVRMAIKVNNENQSEYIAQWKQKTQDAEQQTDLELITILIENFITNMGLPYEIQQKLIESIPSILKPGDQTASVKKQQSFKNIIQKYGFETAQNYNPPENLSQNQSENQIQSQKHSAKQSQDSSDQQNEIPSKYNLSKQSSQNQLNSERNPTQVQKQQSSSRFNNSNQESSQLSKQKTQIIKPSSRQPVEDPQYEEPDNILRMAVEEHDSQELPYEEVVKQIIEKENNGKQLEMLKPTDMKGETFLKTLYNQIANKKSKGIENVQELLRKYYKKGKHENITYYEFKAFFQRLAAIHKMCGQDQMCSHLQRFIMRLGYTCSLFQRRQQLKASTSTIRPFNQSEETTQSKSTITHQNLAQSRFTSPQFYLSEDQFY